jgi:hypothetical protein
MVMASLVKGVEYGKVNIAMSLRNAVPKTEPLVQLPLIW